MYKLYHKKVFWKSEFDNLARSLFNTNYSLHLWEHAMFNTDKHDFTIRELEKIIIEMMEYRRNFYVYEAETLNNTLIKIAIRTNYDLDRDISIVFALSKKNELIVKTAWLNNKSDRHITLDKGKYYKPQRRF